MKINLATTQQLFSQIVASNRLHVDGETTAFSINEDDARFSVVIGGRSYHGWFFTDLSNDKVHLTIDGFYYRFDLIDDSAIKEAMAKQGNIFSSLPGKILSVKVKAGDQLKKGDVVLVQEAMKMEHTLTADRDCGVQEVLVQPDELVEADSLLVKLN